MSTKQIEVRILNQSYRLSCSAESEPDLRSAAERVDQEMQDVHGKTSVRGTDRIAVIAALNLASELIKLQHSVRHGEAFPAEEIRRTISDMNQRIAGAIESFERDAAERDGHSGHASFGEHGGDSQSAGATAS